MIATLGAAWAAFSFWAALAGGLGGGLVILAVVASGWLPGFVRKPLICAGTAIVVLALTFQAGSTDGAHKATLRAQRLSESAETTRVVVASRVTKTQQTRMARDLADEKVHSARLQELLDAARKDPHADRVCVEHDLSRRLRNL